MTWRAETCMCPLSTIIMASWVEKVSHSAVVSPPLRLGHWADDDYGLLSKKTKTPLDNGYHRICVICINTLTLRPKHLKSGRTVLSFFFWGVVFSSGASLWSGGGSWLSSFVVSIVVRSFLLWLCCGPPQLRVFFLIIVVLVARRGFA